MGDISDRILARDLSEAIVPRDGQSLHGRRALLSLYQLIHYAGFHGTVIGFDEAEQGLAVDKKKTQRILSMLQSGINEIVALKNGPVFVMFAITPDLRERFEDFEALRQALEDAGLKSLSAEVTMVPTTQMGLDEKAAEQTLRLLDKLEDLDDVQKVHTNADFPEAVLEKYGSAA